MGFVCVLVLFYQFYNHYYYFISVNCRVPFSYEEGYYYTISRPAYPIKIMAATHDIIKH